MSSKKRREKWNQPEFIPDDLVVEKTQPADKGSGSIRLIGDAKKSNKSTWKALISEKGSTVFNVSDIVTDVNSEGENKPRSDHQDENDGQQDQPSQYKEPEKLSDVQSTKTSASVDNSDKNDGQQDQYKEAEKLCDVQSQSTKTSASCRGASWLQKSSWIQLIADTNSSAFNLSHILPRATLEKQESQQFHELTSAEQHEDQKSPVGEPQTRANTVSPGFDVGKGKNDDAQLNSDSNPSVDADVVQNNRAVGDVVISETCPFMKSNASMKEWMKSKAALSESHKKKDKGKESR